MPGQDIQGCIPGWAGTGTGSSTLSGRRGLAFVKYLTYGEIYVIVIVLLIVYYSMSTNSFAWF